jgi:hypothetical protein
MRSRGIYFRRMDSHRPRHLPSAAAALRLKSGDCSCASHISLHAVEIVSASCAARAEADRVNFKICGRGRGRQSKFQDLRQSMPEAARAAHLADAESDQMRGRGLRRRAAVEQGQGQGADASVLDQPPAARRVGKGGSAARGQGRQRGAWARAAARRVGKGGSAAHDGACLQKSTSESCVLETSAIRK